MFSQFVFVQEKIVSSGTFGTRSPQNEHVSKMTILYEFGMGSGQTLTTIQDQTRAQSRDSATLHVVHIVIVPLHSKPLARLDFVCLFLFPPLVDRIIFRHR